MNTLRKQIDEIDHKIIDLLALRKDVVSEVGRLKKKKGTGVLDSTRWEQVLIDRKGYARDRNVSEEFTAHVWELIHRYSLKIEHSNE